MQFGKTLESSIYQPWRAQYIDYAKLKELIKEDIPSISRESADARGRARCWTEEDEGAFVDELVNIQLEKVNNFHNEIYKDLRDRMSDCESKLQGIAAREKEGDISAPKLQVPTETSEKRMETIVLEKLNGITEEINELEKYSRINYTGFLKAAKKHDRRRGASYLVRPLLQTYILRHLPVLVYNPQTSKAVEGGQHDPRITSLYFDNPGFTLYTEKVGKIAGASSLRLRWYGNLNANPEIYLEKKDAEGNDESDETRFSIKVKQVQDLISCRSSMNKPLSKLRERYGEDSDAFIRLQRNVDTIQFFIREKNLQPMLRADYARTAFQVPGDDKVRISLDTEVVFIREDSLDQERPCRDPYDWHRADIDSPGMEYPFSGIRRGEIARFPYALLEIKVRYDTKKNISEWVGDLMSSHLVKEAPRFSKFVHGTAQLFEDHVNSLPFWLSELETDIRRDPKVAFQEEQEKKVKQAEEEQVVGSFMGSRTGHSFTAGVGSPIPESAEVKGSTLGSGTSKKLNHRAGTEETEDEDASQVILSPRVQTLQSILPSLSRSKYGQYRQSTSKQLPPGIREPGLPAKDARPVQVEPKVWLANQRTFVKWQHISVLLATLSLSLYNAAGKNNIVARSLAITYTLIAATAAGWGWWVYIARSQMIRERSGKEFDNIYGPLAVCLAMITALCLNFGLKRILEAIFPMETLSDYSSFNLNREMDGPAPWDTLEQPSMALCFGKYSGTKTFNRYIGEMNRSAAQVISRSEHKLRRIDLSSIFERLRFLQVTKDIPFVSTKQETAFLHCQLMLDPIFDGCNGSLDRDIHGLCSLLNRETWVDFSDQRQHFVASKYAKEVYDLSAELLFHQLLLSVELDRRISLHIIYNSHHPKEDHMFTMPRRGPCLYTADLKIVECHKILDGVRVERLALVADRQDRTSDLVEHQAAVQFTVGGTDFLIDLRFDVSFVAAAACWAGPHVLHHEYTYETIGVDKIIQILGQTGASGKDQASDDVLATRVGAQDDDAVLVIKAYGAADNAVLARAW
ncbi:MAG: hypothetical protein Q9219_005495 [cf. Caloplaca sp. 3 TL-2023]